MKKLRQWFFLLSALLLTATGAALPYAVSALQDSTVEAIRENRMLNDVSLTLMEGDGIQEVLRLLAGSTSDMEWMGKTNLTEGEAANAVKETLTQLYQNKLIGPEYQVILEESSVYVEPHIIMSMDESDLSAVIWLCWLESIPSNWFFIDDRTGKMVRTFLNETALDFYDLYVFEDFVPDSYNNASLGGDIVHKEAITKRAELWRVFLSEYYGIELTFADEEGFDDGYSIRFDLTFDAGGQKGRVRLELHSTAVFFNL